MVEVKVITKITCFFTSDYHFYLFTLAPSNNSCHLLTVQINYPCLFPSINSESTKLVIPQHRKGLRQEVKHCPTASPFMLCTIINGLPSPPSIIVVGTPYSKTERLTLPCSIIEILCLL